MALMQFASVVMLTLLLLKLLLLPNKVVVNPVMGKARWLMVAGIALLDVQFLLQYSLGLRAMGVTQAVLVNLIFFIPSSWTISLALLYLQRQGHVNRIDKMVGGFIWAVALLMMGVAVATDGQELWSGSSELHNAEVVSSILYLTMQGHYSWKHAKYLRAMRLALQNYYDREMDGMLAWMKISIIVLMILALMVPSLIFVQRQELSIFGLLFCVGIFFLVDSFCVYLVSSSPRKMQKAEFSEKKTVKNEKLAAVIPSTEKPQEESPTEKEPATAIPSTDITEEANSPTVTVHSSIIEQWIKRGGYRHSGLTMPAAADEIGIPRYQLSAWLKQQNLTYAAWMTNLRIEEAKNIMKTHPEWSNEAVASHCGFNDRSYFQKKFKEATGLSPAEFHAL